MLIEYPHLGAFPADGWHAGSPWRNRGAPAPHIWEPQGIALFHFGPHEFDHPELMDSAFLLQLDYYRHICGFPIRVVDDARTNAEHDALYEHEIQHNLPYPQDSAHLHGVGVDLKARLYTVAARATMTWVALEFHRIGIWRKLGLIVETAHHHIDNWPNPKRPYFGIGVSR